MPINLQCTLAGILADFIVAYMEVKWSLPSGAKIQIVYGKSLNEALWLLFPRKPGSPHLNRHPARVVRAAAPARIHQQIPEPPGSAPVGESETNKPDFVAASGRK